MRFTFRAICRAISIKASVSIYIVEGKVFRRLLHIRNGNEFHWMAHELFLVLTCFTYGGDGF